MTLNPIIEIEHVSAGYDADNVLNDVSLNINQGDFVGIIGPNGGGKTTLLRVLLGLKRPLSGRVVYYRDGLPVKNISMGYLPQYNNIDKKFPISVFDVVLSGLCASKPLFRSYSSSHKQQALHIMQKLDIDAMKELHIASLSGGQLQRVLLARAVVSHPELVVLDEPNTYIDSKFQDEMYDMLSLINRDCTVVMVSHDIRTIKNHVRNIALVNRRLIVKPSSDITEEDVEACFYGRDEFML
ncbi:MAG: metal ABC transporter ATP-binding protein [Prevotella sp.]